MKDKVNKEKIDKLLKITRELYETADEENSDTQAMIAETITLNHELQSESEAHNIEFDSIADIVVNRGKSNADLYRILALLDINVDVG